MWIWFVDTALFFQSRLYIVYFSLNRYQWWSPSYERTQKTSFGCSDWQIHAANVPWFGKVCITSLLFQLRNSDRSIHMRSFWIQSICEMMFKFIASRVIIIGNNLGNKCQTHYTKLTGSRLSCLSPSPVGLFYYNTFRNPSWVFYQSTNGRLI